MYSTNTAYSHYFPNSLMQPSSDFSTLISPDWLFHSALPSWKFIWHHLKNTKDWVIFLITLAKSSSYSSAAMIIGLTRSSLSNLRTLKDFFKFHQYIKYKISCWTWEFMGIYNWSIFELTFLRTDKMSSKPHCQF